MRDRPQDEVPVGEEADVAVFAVGKSAASALTKSTLSISKM
jgi:hypothetical protein